MLFLLLMPSVTAQLLPYCHTVQIYNADELINQIKNKGSLETLAGIIGPDDLVRLDSSYLKILVDAEFRHGFWSKDEDNPKITYYGKPQVTLELANEFQDAEIGNRLYDYYIRIPKKIKSDTIYTVYNDLDGFLNVLVNYKHPNLIERLKRDYREWMRLAEKAPPKSYPPKPKRDGSGPPWEEQMKLAKQAKFKPDYLYVDCYYMALQVAGALQYMKIKGFDDVLMEQLRAKQTYTYAENYSFPKLTKFITSQPYRKTIANTTSISDFKTDYKKVEKLIRDNFGDCCNSRLCEIVEKGSKAYVYFDRNNGSDTYIIYLKANNTIVIEMGSMIMSDPAFD